MAKAARDRHISNRVLEQRLLLPGQRRLDAPAARPPVPAPPASPPPRRAAAHARSRRNTRTAAASRRAAPRRRATRRTPARTAPAATASGSFAVERGDCVRRQLRRQRQGRGGRLLPRHDRRVRRHADDAERDFDAARVEQHAGERADRRLERQRRAADQAPARHLAARPTPAPSARAGVAPAKTSAPFPRTSRPDAARASPASPACSRPDAPSSAMTIDLGARDRRPARRRGDRGVENCSTGDACWMSSALPCAIAPSGSIRRTSAIRSRPASVCARAPPSAPHPTIAMNRHRSRLFINGMAHDVSQVPVTRCAASRQRCGREGRAGHRRIEGHRPRDRACARGSAARTWSMTGRIRRALDEAAAASSPAAQRRDRTRARAMCSDAGDAARPSPARCRPLAASTCWSTTPASAVRERRRHVGVGLAADNRHEPERRVLLLPRGASRAAPARRRLDHQHQQPGRRRTRSPAARRTARRRPG